MRLSAGLGLVDLTRSEVDVAIRFGYGPDPSDLYSEHFLDDWVTPMMTPELAETYGTPKGLARAPLIHQEDIDFLNPRVDWPTWFRAAGLPPRSWAGQRYSQADHAIDAALSGAGVVLGRITFGARFLDDGRLVAPFRPALNTLAHYRFLCVKGFEKTTQVAAFRNWLLDQIAGTTDRAYLHDLIDPRDVSDAS